MNKALLHEHGAYTPVSFGHRPQPNDNWPYHGQPQSGFNPQYGINGPKMEKHIFIRRDNILFDIDAQIGMVADARRTPEGVEDETLTGATNKYASMFYRWIDNHVGEAKTIMSADVVERSEKTAMNSIKDNEEVDIFMLFPEWYDDTTFQQLCSAVHDFVVNATLADFFVMRLTSKDPVTIDKKEATENYRNEVRKLVNMAKPGTISKPFKPF